MDPIRLFSIISWILLPTVMFGGYSLLHLQVREEVLTPFQEIYFRAGHAHAGALLLLSLLYYQYLGHTSSSVLVRWMACAAVLVGLLAIAGGSSCIWREESQGVARLVSWSRIWG